MVSIKNKRQLNYYIFFCYLFIALGFVEAICYYITHNYTEYKWALICFSWAILIALNYATFKPIFLTCKQRKIVRQLKEMHKLKRWQIKLSATCQRHLGVTPENYSVHITGYPVYPDIVLRYKKVGELIDADRENLRKYFKHNL